MINIRPDEISSIIREQIEKYDQDVKVDNIGTVLQVGDGIARVYGLDQVMSGELLEFEVGYAPKTFESNGAYIEIISDDDLEYSGPLV